MDQCVVQQTIACNGPAVEGVNVTRRSHPGSIPVTRASGTSNLSRWRGGYGAIFANPGTSYLSRFITILSTSSQQSKLSIGKFICQDEVVKMARKNCDKFITPTVRVSG